MRYHKYQDTNILFNTRNLQKVIDNQLVSKEKLQLKNGKIKAIISSKKLEVYKQSRRSVGYRCSD